MTDGWIKWNGGDCPIKSDKTQVEYELRRGYILKAPAQSLRWSDIASISDIIAYRIIEDHEPMTQPMTREELTAQIKALQKKLADMPTSSRFWYAKGEIYTILHFAATHYFDIETINGIPHIHGIAMKEVAK